MSLQVIEPGVVNFDQYFAPKGQGNPNGTDGSDQAKFATLDSWLGSRPGNSARPDVAFDARAYTFTSLGLWAGMHLRGVKPVREYLTGTVFNCTQPNAFRWVTNTGYSYPSQGAPRQVDLDNIMFNMGSGRNFVEPVTTWVTSKVLWMSSWTGCGWIGPQTIMNGFVDGLSVSDYHVQGYFDTVFTLRGSECLLTGGRMHCFVDSASNMPGNQAGKPFMNLALSKSCVRDVMISSRGKAWGLQISGGEGLLVHNVAFDAPDNEPTFGAAVKITSGSGIVFDGCSWKGMMGTPGSATGNNRAWCDIAAGSEITFMGNRYRRAGNSQPATTVPLVYTASGVTGVKFGSNVLSGFGGQKACLKQQSAGIITNQDPSVTVV